MQASNGWVILEKVEPKDGIISMSDETRYLEAIGTPGRVVSCGKIFNGKEYVDPIWENGSLVMASFIGCIRIRSGEKLLYAVRDSYILCTLTEEDFTYGN